MSEILGSLRSSPLLGAVVMTLIFVGQVCGQTEQSRESAGLASLEMAQQISSNTGRPIFAVAGKST